MCYSFVVRVPHFYKKVVYLLIMVSVNNVVRFIMLPEMDSDGSVELTRAQRCIIWGSVEIQGMSFGICFEIDVFFLCMYGY